MIRKITSLAWLFPVLAVSLYSFTQAQTPSTQTPSREAYPLIQTPSREASPQNAPVLTQAPAGSDEDLGYRIGPGDELDIRVFGRAELSRTVRVDNYGKIRLPFLKEMQAACYTEAQVAGFVAEAYKKFLRDPQVDVLVKDYRSQPVAVIGAVNQPGRFQLQRRARALELITFAVGPKSSAVGGVVHIIHNDELNRCSQPGARKQPANDGNGNRPANGENGNQLANGGNGIQPANGENGIQPANDENGNSIAYAITSIKLSDMLAGSPDSNPFVQPGDVISVPEADQIFVTGFVVRPGPFAMVPGLTLSQAVAMAGGANPEGSIGRVRLVRGTPGKGDRKETVYSLHDIHKRKTQDVALQANDIVEIPSSTSRIASRGALGVGLNLLNALPFFIIR